MARHEPTRMVWSHRSNQKHTHNTRHGPRGRNHWFKVYKCPVCGLTASHKRQPIICRGVELTEEEKAVALDRLIERMEVLKERLTAAQHEETTMGKYTPGPWHLLRHENGELYKGSKTGDVCVAHQHGEIADVTVLANAHLIAAAPEMYELLKEMTENPPACLARIMEAAPRAGCECWQCERTGRAVAIVAKAEGR